MTDTTSAVEKEENVLIARDGYPITFDEFIPQLLHDFDPLGVVLSALHSSFFIKKLNVPSDILCIITLLVGYIESKWNDKNGEPLDCCYDAYSCNASDCELCFLLWLPRTSTYNYTLHAFKCQVRNTTADEAKVVVRIAEFYDQSRFALSKNSSVVSNSDSDIDSDSDLDDESQVASSDENNMVCIWESNVISMKPNEDDLYAGIEFSDLNLPLSNIMSYVIRVDVLEGCVSCNELSKKAVNLNYANVEMVCDRTRFYHRRYTLRPRDLGKLYELVLM